MKEPSEAVTTLDMLARSRVLSLDMERAWMARTGNNPVESAIECMAAHKQEKNEKQNMLRGVFSAAIAIAVTVLITNSSISDGNHAWLLGTASVIAGLTFVDALYFFLLGFIEVVWYQQKISEKIQEVELFWSDCKAFASWTRVNTWTWEFEEMKRLADQAMLDITSKLIEYPSEEEVLASDDAAYRQEYNRLRLDMNVRYDTLARLGLTTGSPKRYYDMARKRRDESNQDIGGT